MPIDTTLRAQAENAAKAHWRKFSGEPLGKRRVEDYITNVLPLELACARSDADLPPRLPAEGKQGGTLVLLVGFSIEPLLQAVCVYKPSRVVLVLNARYGEKPDGWTAREFGQTVGGFFKLLAPTLIDHAPDCEECSWVVLEDRQGRPTDQPADVFRQLRDALLPRLRNGERIVVDVTGGKKSMVSGAFFFGAFSGVDLSYVDFDEYDPKERAPRGYTCRIGLLQNPYELFHLRNWQRVREVYRQYAFRSCREILIDIERAMKTPVTHGPPTELLFSQKELDAVERLSRMLGVYECWENGDLYRAKQLADELRKPMSAFRPPTAVEQLGPLWPSPDDMTDASKLLACVATLEVGEPNPSLYSQDQQLLTYALDELAKIRRLIACNEDCRSALLRSAGLHETLLKARAVRLWYADEFVLDIDGREFHRSQLADDSARKSIDRKLAETSGVPALIASLRWEPEPSKDPYRLPVFDLKVREAAATAGKGTMHRSNAAQRKLDKFWSTCAMNINDFPILRNKASHFCLSVTRPIADAAIDLAQANLCDFEANWLEATVQGAWTQELRANVQTEALPWTQVCSLCGIDFLPPLVSTETDK